MSLLDELNPTCPRGCGRTMDDCHEAEDGGECEGGELLRENERLTAELGIAEDLVAAGITKRDKLRAELKKLRAELAEAKRELAILADFLHARSEHPAYEYATTTGPRKAFDNYDLPPDGEGWEPNVHSGNDDAWSRLEYHEERYWRRLWVDKDHETGAPVWADWHVPSQAVVSEAVAHAVTEGTRRADTEIRAARAGYEQAIATLRDVSERTGSPAARWAADYLAVDPDKLSPAAVTFATLAVETGKLADDLAAAKSTADGPEQTDEAEQAVDVRDCGCIYGPGRQLQVCGTRHQVINFASIEVLP